MAASWQTCNSRPNQALGHHRRQSFRLLRSPGWCYPTSLWTSAGTRGCRSVEGTSRAESHSVYLAGLGFRWVAFFI